MLKISILLAILPLMILNRLFQFEPLLSQILRRLFRYVMQIDIDLLRLPLIHNFDFFLKIRQRFQGEVLYRYFPHLTSQLAQNFCEVFGAEGKSIVFVEQSVES